LYEGFFHELNNNACKSFSGKFTKFQSFEAYTSETAYQDTALIQLNSN